MRKVLVICSRLPPSTHVGAKRPGWFAKILPEFGWQTFFLMPSAGFWSIPRMVVRGLRLVSKERIDILYSTSPNADTHLIGWLIQLFSRASWICEFRDPWTLQYDYRNPLRKIWQRFLERQYLRRAAHVVTVGQVLKAHFRDRGGVPDKKISVIYNGYEKPDGVPPSSGTALTDGAGDQLRIGYFGSFNPFSSPLPFIRALGKLLRKRPELRGLIRCDWIGYFKNAEGLRQECLNAIAEEQLQDVIHWRTEVPFHEGMAFLRETNLLLLPVGGPSGPPALFRSRIPAKLFDYLALEKKILALAPPDGETARILRAAGCGIVVPYADEEAIANALEEAVARRREKWVATAAQRLVIDRFDIRLQMKQLSIVLNKLAGYPLVPSMTGRLKQSLMQAFFLGAGVAYAPWKLWRRRRLRQAPLRSALILASHSGLGNTLLLLPMISALKKKFPALKVSVLVRSGASAELLRCQPSVDDVIHLSVLGGLSFAREAPLLYRRLRKRSFDLAVSTFLEPYPENALRALISRAPYRISFNRGIYGALDTFTLASDPERHEVENQELIADCLGIEKSAMPSLSFPDQAAAFAGEYLERHLLTHKPLVGVHPGSDRATGRKRWSLENFLAAADKIRQGYPSAQFLFFFGPEDDALRETFESRERPGLHAVAGLSVSQIASLIRRCRTFLSNDSGLMHLAAGLRIPVVAIFGPTIPAKNSPWGTGHSVVREELPCSPCYDWRFFREEQGRSAFDPPCNGSMECLHSISPDRAAQEVLLRLVKGAQKSSLEVQPYAVA